MGVMNGTTAVWMALLACSWLGISFTRAHVLGCVFAVASVFVGVCGRLLHSDCSQAGMDAGNCLNSYKDGAGIWVRLDDGAMLFWYGLFMAGVVPQAVALVYSQKVMQFHDMDPLYNKCWVDVFQVFAGWLCVWVAWIPTPGQDPAKPSQTFSLLRDTLHCLGGGVPHTGDESCEADGLPPLFWFFFYLVFNFVFGLLQTFLIKRKSAVWTQLASVLSLNLTNAFSQFSLLAGKGAQKMSVDDWLATAIASLALTIYSSKPEKNVQTDACLTTTLCSETNVLSE